MVVIPSAIAPNNRRRCDMDLSPPTVRVPEQKEARVITFMLSGAEVGTNNSDLETTGEGYLVEPQRRPIALARPEHSAIMVFNSSGVID